MTGDEPTVFVAPDIDPEDASTVDDGGGVPASDPEVEAPLVVRDTRPPWRTKKWTLTIWLGTLLMAFVFYYSTLDDPQDGPVIYMALALYGAISMLGIGGVYALDRYRMGLTDIVRAVKGQEPGSTEDALPLPEIPAAELEILGDDTDEKRE